MKKYLLIFMLTLPGASFCAWYDGVGEYVATGVGTVLGTALTAILTANPIAAGLGGSAGGATGKVIWNTVHDRVAVVDNKGTSGN